MKHETIAALKGQVRPRGGKRAPRVQPAPSEPMKAPTDEQAARYDYVRTEIRDEGRWIGFAYRKRPLVESLAEKIGLTTADLAALRYYRTAFERADMSPTKSCLDVGVGGGGGNGTEGRALAAIEQAVAAKAIVARCERAIGAAADTMREVAVFDRSFTDIAMQRYGSRTQSWIVDGEPGGSKVHRDRQVPRSGRHREIIADEFMQGTRSLVRLLSGYRPMTGSGHITDPITVAKEKVSLSAAISAAVVLTPGAAALWMAESTLSDLYRDLDGGGITPVGDDHAGEFCGIPIIVRPDWSWGWTLLVDNEGACTGATEMA